MISIDFMNIEDTEQVCRVDEACFSVPWSKNAFLGDLASDNTVYLVAKNEGRAVGYAGMWCVAGDGDITNIAVLPEYRRAGIAQALLSRLITEAGKRDTENIRLEVRESNAAAIALYEKNGFSKIGVRKKYYKDNGENALLMEKIMFGGNES